MELEIGSSDSFKSNSSNQRMLVDDPEEEQYSIAKDRPRRDIRPPQRYANLVAYALSVAEEISKVDEPTTFSDAVSYDNSAKWLIVMNKEIESLHQNRTWELVKPPSSKKIVGCKWDTIVEGKVLVQKIHTKDNPVDMLTKPVSVYKFKKCLDLVGVHCW